MTNYVVRLASSCVLALGWVAIACAQTGSPDANIDRSASLRVVWVGPPAAYDPATAKNQFQNTPYSWPIYDALVRINANGDLVPDLATSWSFSPDKRTLTFKLRNGVKFTDGSEVNAAAVARSLTRTQKDPASMLAVQLRSVNSFEAPDPSTVVAHLNTGDENILYTLATSTGMIVSAKALDSGTDIGLNPVGSGPYKLASSGPQGATYVRNEDYFDKSQNQFAKLAIGYIADQTARLNAVLTGQADVGLFQADPQFMARAQEMVRSGKFTMHSVLAPNSMPLWLNIKIKPLDNPKVRLALSLALDREAINEGIHAGACRPAGQPLPPGIVGHDENLKPPKRDVERAKQLLKEAGVGPVEFDAIVGDFEPVASTATAIKAQLRDIGVNMNIIPTQGPNVRVQFRTGKYGGMVFNASVPAPDPASIIDAFYMSPDNPGGVTPEFTRALAVARSTSIGSPEREAAFKAVSKVAYENPNQIYVCWSPNVLVARKGIVGIEKTPYLNAAPIPDVRTYAAVKSAQ